MSSRSLKKFRIGRREIIVIISSVIITTVGIKAADRFSVKFTGQEKNNCPSDMVYVSSIQGGFCIDKFEVSAGEKCKNPVPTSQQQTRENMDNFDCRAQSVAGAIPWTNVSQNQAAEICAKLGKRLPGGSEWQLAAMATPDKDADWTADDCQVGNNWTNQPGKTGSGKNCVSGVGAYDMIGNVWEWVAETISDGKYKEIILPKEGYVTAVAENAVPITTDPNQSDANYHADYFWIKNKGWRAMARGGLWNNQKEAGQYSIYLVNEPSAAGSGIGFRCVK